MKFLILSLIFASILVGIKSDEKKLNCKHLKSDDFDDEIRGSKFAFIYFYEPKCKHCVKYTSYWNAIVKKYKANEDLKIACVHCLKEKELCAKEGVFGYPSLFWYQYGEFVHEYEYERDEKHLIDFADSWQDPESKKDWERRRELLNRDEL